MYTLSLCPPSPFLFTYTPPTEIYTLSLHDALPIYLEEERRVARVLRLDLRRHAIALPPVRRVDLLVAARLAPRVLRSEEHTSELQSLRHLVCRLLLEKKKQNI